MLLVVVEPTDQYSAVVSLLSVLFSLCGRGSFSMLIIAASFPNSFPECCSHIIILTVAGGETCPVARLLASSCIQLLNTPTLCLLI